MTIKIVCKLNSLSSDLDIIERREFLESIEAEQTPEFISSELIVNQATRTILDELSSKTEKLHPAIKNSAAFVALEKNLFEYVKNAVDAKAQCITINIAEQLKEGHVTIHVDDDGKPFKSSMLGEQDKRNYQEVLKGAARLASSKQKEKKEGEVHLLGGCGLGLKFTSDFLQQHSGSLLIGQRPKLQLLSLPHDNRLDLRKAFREARTTILERQEEVTDNGQVIDLMEIDEPSERFPVEEKQKQHSPSNNLGLRLMISDKEIGRITPRSSGSETSKSTPGSVFHSPIGMFSPPSLHATPTLDSPRPIPLISPFFKK